MSDFGGKEPSMVFLSETPQAKIRFSASIDEEKKKNADSFSSYLLKANRIFFFFVHDYPLMFMHFFQQKSLEIEA